MELDGFIEFDVIIMKNLLCELEFEVELLFYDIVYLVCSLFFYDRYF